MTEVLSPLAELRRALSRASELGAIENALISFVAREVGANRERDVVRFIEVAQITPALEWQRRGLSFGDEGVRLFGHEIKSPIVVSDPERQQVAPVLRDFLADHQMRSYALVPAFSAGRVVGLLEIEWYTQFVRFRREQIAMLEIAAELFALHYARLKELPQEQEESPPPAPPQFVSEEAPVVAEQKNPEPPGDVLSAELYDRVSRNGDLFVLQFSADLKLIRTHGDVSRLTGCRLEELRRRGYHWRHIFQRSELHRVLAKFRFRPVAAFSEELSLQPLGALNRLNVGLRAVPVLDSEGAVQTWDCFVTDVTAQRKAEEQARAQGRRIEALYEVARSLELNLDPSVVALKGLRALLKATNSECGFSGLVDATTGQLEVVATEGLSSHYIEEVGKIIGNRTIAHDAVERREGVLLPDIQQEPRAAVELARAEGLHATIIMPLVFEEHVLGVMVLFRRDESQYLPEDYDLVSAACSQIALAARQAELYAAEKRHSSSLSALYRLSHELSRQMTLKEVAEHAFPAIQEEIACKRMWLGVMNNRGSHLTGTAGVGPGIRRHLIDLQVELGVRNDFLDEAIQKRVPVVVEPNQEIECGELGKILKRLNCGTIVVVPLVSLGQVVGALVVEPAVPSSFFVQRKLPLLNSMATEIATVILARKFEARMADADKMRMAGLLASGVAHNFNNLLQAVMGQASLIEMQLPHENRVVAAARMIAEAAGKGAALVKQLFNFSMQGNFAPQTLQIRQFLNEARELYRSVLGSTFTLEYDVADDCPEIVADPAQLQQVLTNLVVNSKEALEGKSEGIVKIVARRVRVRSGEVDPELAPGEYLRVEVEDNGMGMTPESQARCFEPFFTTKNTDTRTGLSFGGSGLGLSSAYSIVKQHEGIITVRSQLGRGATFSIYLPAGVGKSAETGDLTAGIPTIANVVIFEIDHAIAFSLRASVEAPDVLVSVPLSRERVVQMAEQMHTERLVVVVDSDRLGGAALEFFQQIAAVHPEAKILAYAADLSSAEARYRENSSVTVCEKPLRIWSMSEHIRQALGRPVGPASANVRAGLSGQIQAERVTSSARRSAEGVDSVSPGKADQGNLGRKLT